MKHIDTQKETYFPIISAIVLILKCSLVCNYTESDDTLSNIQREQKYVVTYVGLYAVGKLQSGTTEKSSPCHQEMTMMMISQTFMAKIPRKQKWLVMMQIP
ncbi:Uncharacterized protein DAT39_004578, partial [Clarias magur]